MISLKKIKIISLIFLVIIGIILINPMRKIKGVMFDQPLDSITIVLDAGHGGYDPGANAEGVNEAGLNLAIAKKLESVLVASGATVIMTRESDIDLASNHEGSVKRADMKKRTEILSREDATLFISLHGNISSDNSCHGSQIYYQIKDQNSKELAIIIQESLAKITESKYIPVSGDFFVLNNSKNIGVLIEYGFLSNNNELNKLLNDKYQEAIAYSIYEGIVNFLNKIK